MTGSSVPPHILALNDSAEVLELFAELLEEEGYRVTTQPYATRYFPAIVDMAPDLIILDYMWATDDTGWSLLQMLKMKPSTQAIPVVVCTGAVVQVEALKSHLDEMEVQVVQAVQHRRSAPDDQLRSGGRHAVILRRALSEGDITFPRR